MFDAVGQKTIWVGEAGAGTRLKLVANSWVLTVVEGAAETFALAEGFGLDPQLFLDAIDGGALDLPYLRLKGKAIWRATSSPASACAWPPRTRGWSTSPLGQRELDLPLFAAIAQRMTGGRAGPTARRT